MEIFKTFRPDLSVSTIRDTINGGKMLRVGNTGFQVEISEPGSLAISRFAPFGQLEHKEEVSVENSILLSAALRAYQTFLRRGVGKSVFTLDEISFLFGPIKNPKIKEFTLGLFSKSDTRGIVMIDRKTLREQNTEVFVINSKKLMNLSEKDPLTRRLEMAHRVAIQASLR